ncbi:MAG: dTMP kinase [Burkholderiaceae bacterium]|nr:dTMP kinase [Burkholderiaceae bacterium]
MRGKFIVLEGIDGAGKSTHVEFIAQSIRESHGVQVLVTREPGGTPLAEKIRGLVLHEPMDVETEVLLVTAARRDHVARVIRPALEAGQWVVCDRFVDSTRAYQGGGGGVSLGWIDELSESATSGLSPDRVYLFDAPAALAAQRRGGRGQAEDRFEAQDLAYFERVRDVYLNQQRLFSEASFLVIDSSMSVSRIQNLLLIDIATL